MVLDFNDTYANKREFTGNKYKERENFYINENICGLSHTKKSKNLDPDLLFCTQLTLPPPYKSKCPPVGCMPHVQNHCLSCIHVERLGWCSVITCYKQCAIGSRILIFRTNLPFDFLSFFYCYVLIYIMFMFLMYCDLHA